MPSLLRYISTLPSHGFPGFFIDPALSFRFSVPRVTPRVRCVYIRNTSRELEHFSEFQRARKFLEGEKSAERFPRDDVVGDRSIARETLLIPRRAMRKGQRALQRRVTKRKVLLLVRLV